MGRYDSTRTRVAPVFDTLFARDPSGAAWLAPLLGLPRQPDGGSANAARPVTPPLQTWGWGAHECRVRPPRQLLHWLVDHVVAPADEPATNRAQHPAGHQLATAADPGAAPGRDAGSRARLLEGDAATRQLAHALIDAGPARRAWYVLEGMSQPDVLLATHDAVVVIEGKRTESGPTMRTKWLPGRDQMLRHLDASYDLAGGRRVYGFYIVEGARDSAADAVPGVWRDAAAALTDPATLAAGLPHRTPAEREAIAGTFLGVTTWQAVCDALAVPYTDLPNEVIDAPRAVPASPGRGADSGRGR